MIAMAAAKSTADKGVEATSKGLHRAAAATKRGVEKAGDAAKRVADKTKAAIHKPKPEEPKSDK